MLKQAVLLAIIFFSRFALADYCHDRNIDAIRQVQEYCGSTSCSLYGGSECNNVRIGPFPTPDPLHVGPYIVSDFTDCNTSITDTRAHVALWKCVSEDLAVVDDNRKKYSLRPPINQCKSNFKHEDQAIVERIPLAGVNFDLLYNSNFVAGKEDFYKAEVKLTSDPLDANIVSFNITVNREGLTPLNYSFQNNTINQKLVLSWDGKDSNGTLQQGFKKFAVDVDIVYPEYTYPSKSEVFIGNFKTQVLGLGSWAPSIYKFYDVGAKRIGDMSGKVSQVQAAILGPAQIYVASEDSSEVYIFDSTSGRHLFTKTGLTGTTIYTFSYDSVGRLTSISEPFSRVTTFVRDLSGNLTSIISPNGSTTAISLDSNGNIASVINPASETYSMSYSGSDGLLLSLQKPGQQLTSYTYDNIGKVTRTAHSGGLFFDLVRKISAYDFEMDIESAMGRVGNIRSFPDVSSANQTVTYPSGMMETYQAALSSGTLSETVNSGGLIINRFYAEDTRFPGMSRYLDNQSLSSGVVNIGIQNTKAYTLTNSTDPFSISSLLFTSAVSGTNTAVTTIYDPSTKKFTSTTTLGQTSETTIDNYERVVGKKIGNLNLVSLNYTNEHLTSVVQGTRTTSLGYHSTTGNLQSITNPLSQTTSFVYDNANRVTSKILPDARAIGFGYDANGNVTSVTPPNRPAHYFSVNGHELVGSYAPPALSGVSVVNTLYSYNLDKQLTQVTRPDGAVIDYNYNATTGVLENFVTPDGTYTLTMDYSNGLPSSIVTADGYQTQISYAGRAMIGSTVYDSAWGMIGTYAPSFTNMLVQSDSVTGGDWNASQVNYAYDDDENLTGAGDLTLAYNVPNGQLTGTSITSGSNTITDVYTYNNYGEVTGYEAKFGTTTIYSLSLPRDASGRINGKTQTMSSTTDAFEYTFDLTGRLTETKKNSVVVATYAYDSNSNRNGGTIGSQPTTATYDDQDRLSTYNTLSFTYNANGDLLTKTNNTLSQTIQYVYDVFGNLKQVTLPNTTVISYEIDGLNRRVGRKVNGVLDRRWIYMDQYRIAAETDASGVITKRFVYGLKGNIPDYMISGGENYRIISDHLGSPRLVVKVSDGTIIHQMNHDEFGRVTQDTNPGYLPFGFAGGLYDTQTGLVRFGARDYDAEVGRWTSKDPILFNGGDANLYGYVQKDPVNWTDPSGLDRRRCSRNLKGSPIKVGKLRHDYVQFRDSKGNIVIKSWGNSGMINESSSAEGLQCEDWKKSSDKADSLAMGLADNLNDLMSYDLINYNCQNYSTDVLSFQMGQ